VVIAILQARLGSKRLPGKVLLPLHGAPMLQRQIERILSSRKIDRLVLATSTAEADDALVKLACELSLECFRGSLDDVLDRFYQAALPHHPKHIVRLTGDCPLVDPEIIDAVVQKHLDDGNDYTSNGLPPTFPDGLDVEVMKFTALEIAWQRAKKKSEREHVTLFLYSHPEEFRLGNVRSTVDHSSMRWTVDMKEDYQFVSAVYEELYDRNPRFRYNDILALLKSRPELSAVNFGIMRNEGLAISLKMDADLKGEK